MKIITTLDQAAFKPFAITITFNSSWEAQNLIDALEEAIHNGIGVEDFGDLIKATAKGI